MREAIRASGVIGTFGCADVGGPFPGVLALGGSSGGIPENILDMLIPAGFASLGLAYFAGPTAPDLTHEGLPADLVEIPLERIERGLRWLIQHPNASTPDGRVGLIGVSKGGELALLVAATFPELVGPVVAYTPSSVVWQGITWSAVAQQTRQALSSWTFRGEPLLFVPYPVGVAGKISARGLAVRPIYDKGLDDTRAVERAAIPIERATGPILVISGSDDQMWPAERMCRMVVNRMRRFGRGEHITHLNYPDAGHRLFPWVPAADDEARGLPVAFDRGGSLAAATAADTDARPRIIAHLRGSA
jgi:hypothetical protein